MSRIAFPSSFFLFLCASLALSAQECLRPLQSAPRPLTNTACKSPTTLTLPFFEDFSNYQGTPDPRLWEPSGAWVNRDYDMLPPTVGLVTLDALDADGNLYPGASISQFSADTLLSRAIRLDSLWSPAPQALRPSDSVCFSFFYLPGGGDSVMWQRIGACPGEKDSLILEFWNAATSSWNMVWSCGGIPLDSLRVHTGHRWQQVSFTIQNAAFFSSSFRFRFRNYCSLDDIAELGMVGNTDQWLLDYISIEAHGNSSNRYHRDVAFVGQPPSLLEHYQAMPFRQYDPDDMASQLSITITNLYSQAVATHYGFSVSAPDASEIYYYDGGYANAPTFLPTEQYQTETAHASPTVAFAFPQCNEATTYTICHVVREGVGGDDHQQNDTMVFRQVFANYYAYDDGTPENGYGVAQCMKPAIACRFPLHVADTLTAVDLFFNRTRDGENETMGFALAVWDDNNGTPGRLLYSDNAVRIPAFDGLNRYHRYALEQPLLVSGTVYVGLVQTDKGFINLGFDRNHDARQQCFYKAGNNWSQTVYSGALMLRPCFGGSALVGVAHPADAPRIPSLKVYPVPFSDKVSFVPGTACLDGCDIEILDARGVAVFCGVFQSSLSLPHLRQGVYFVRVFDADGLKAVSKIIKK